ncbi:MAG: hypothetical protein HWN80_17610 [Candidatus Lokiarchaeota archaeon]|nr:hypothetical protein [Candidatus Lokiarchaeota archaeon]
MTTAKCLKCSKDYSISLKHKIFIRLYDKVKGKKKERHTQIGWLCPNCLDIQVFKIDRKLIDEIPKKKKP